MSILILIAKAQSIELQKNNATEVSMIGLRPKISESLAHIGPAAAFAKRYAPPIHTYPEADFSSETIVGTAVAMMVWSSAAMKRDN
jgi:hypothetical protein